MCLDTIDKYVKFEGEGWKVFLKSKRGLYSDIFFEEGATPYPINKWIKEKDFRPRHKRGKNTIKISRYKEYDCGFHIFSTREQARDCPREESVIRKVKFRNVVCTGDQYQYGPVIVAKEILILPIRKR